MYISRDIRFNEKKDCYKFNLSPSQYIIKKLEEEKIK